MRRKKEHRSFLVEGIWFRSTGYRLLDGAVVPKAGSVLEVYDPWQSFRANLGKYRTVEQPYTSMLNLGAKVAAVRARNASQSVAMENDEIGKLVLEWCDVNGLLGLLPVKSTMIRHQEAGPDPEWVASKREFLRADSKLISVLIHKKDSGKWHTQRWHYDEAKYNAKEVSSGVTWQEYYDWQKHDLKWLAQFYPQSLFEQGPGETPCPNTPQFFAVYREPVSMIAQSCEEFWFYVKNACAWEGGDKTKENQSRRFKAIVAYRNLNALAEKAVSTFKYNPRRRSLKEARISPGLLPSLALMFLWDIAEGRRAIQCANCHSFFVSDEHRAKYCSPRCRNTAQGRRSREKRGASKP